MKTSTKNHSDAENQSEGRFNPEAGLEVDPAAPAIAENPEPISAETVRNVEPSEDTSTVQPTRTFAELLAEFQAELEANESSQRRAIRDEANVLVASLEAGNIPETAVVREVLARVGWTPDELAERVKTLTVRRAAAEKLQLGIEAEKILPKCNLELQELKSAHDKFIAEHQEKEWAVVMKRRDAVEAIQAAPHARSLLVDTCKDPEACATIKAMGQRGELIAKETSQLQRQVDSRQIALNKLRGQVNAPRQPGVSTQQFKESQRQTELEIARVSGEVSELQTRLEALRQEMNTINDTYVAEQIKHMCRPEVF